jgi:hypothetical protein
MNTPRTPTVTMSNNRTGLAWREYNSMPPTPSPEVTASLDDVAPDDITPAMATLSLDPLDDVTPIVPPRCTTPPTGSPAVVASPAVIQPVASPQALGRSKALLIVAGAVVTGALAGAIVFFPGTKTLGKKASPGSVIPTAVTPVKPEVTPWPNPVVEHVFPSEAAQPGAPAVPAEASPSVKRHIEITVQPAKASLSLDKRAAEGNQIKLDVSPSRNLHMVQARAPGHIPFKKMISYADDVYLEIRLEKVEAPTQHVAAVIPSPQVAAQPRGNELKPEVKGEPKVAPSAPAIEEFGMNLEHPITRHSTKKMDETDPYAP